jgi:hypothetical protein
MVSVPVGPVRYVSLDHDVPCRIQRMQHIWVVIIVAEVANICDRLT